MNKKDVELVLKSIQSNSKYMRVSDTHPLELYLGKSEKGLYTLRYNGQFRPIKLVGSGLIEIKQVQTLNHYSLLFSYNSTENMTLFYNFCEDIINQTDKYCGDDGYIEIVNRYHQWKKMFYGSSKILSENEVLGLIGELLFLEEKAFAIYGITKGLNGWSGPEPTHKDFSFVNEWYEIKSINSYKNSFYVSSIEQLDGETQGKLVIYIFEKMSPSFEGITLNNLVKNIMNVIALEQDKDIFVEKLKQVGYGYDEVYDNYVYNLISMCQYSVNSEFPRLKSCDIPRGIGKVQYEVLLPYIEPFKEE